MASLEITTGKLSVSRQSEQEKKQNKTKINQIIKCIETETSVCLAIVCVVAS